MKKFKFRLQKVLQHRNSILNEKRRILLEKNLTLTKEREHLDRLEQSFLRSDAADGGVFLAESYLMTGLFIDRLRSEIVSQISACQRAEEAVQEAVLDYLEAKKDEQALVKLKEQKLKEYNEALLRHDQNTIDELVTQRFGIQLVESRKQTTSSNQILD